MVSDYFRHLNDKCFSRVVKVLILIKIVEKKLRNFRKFLSDYLETKKFSFFNFNIEVNQQAIALAILTLTSD
ncbi:hypothetical protein BpHYR1_013733 [Brachionus plicatilis]|uniref:Uncharacterized protein n=1 Tax=Brachionus plicatilis TaxID=10195 RepID=A0A3M7PB89_BRAPC|nr:hypothetical protein BpHYR1_013733 [Brachionus plicatilis]